MATKTDTSIDDLVYNRIVEKGGSFRANHGENFIGNVGSALRLAGNINNARIYEAVCRLVQSGRLIKTETSDTVMAYGTHSDPKEVGSYPVAEYRVAQK